MPERNGQPAGEGRRILIAFVIACAFLMQGIDTTLLTVAIPTVARNLAVNPLLLHLAITAYLVSLAVFMPISGWFSDRFGARTVFVAAMIVFTLGSIFCGMAPNLGVLVLARVVQGVGGAMMTPVGRLIVLRAFGAGRTLDAMTYLTLPVLIGPLLGPLLGAVIISFASWRWIFYVNVPVCAVTIALTMMFVERDAPGRPEPFDGSGFLLSGIALVLFQLGIEHLGEPVFGAVATAALLIGGIAVFFVYAAHARRVPKPALELSLFRIPSFSVGVIAGGIGRVGLNSSAFLLPLLLQLGFGMAPITAALYSALSAFGSLAAKPILRRCLRLFGYGPTITGLVLAGAALMGGFSLMTAATPVYVLGPYVILLGTIRTMHFNCVNTLTYSEIPPDFLSRSVSSAGVFQQLSMGMGVSLSAVVLAMIVPQAAIPTVPEFSIAFLAMAVVPLLSLPVLIQLRRKPETSDLSRPAAIAGAEPVSGSGSPA